MRSSLREKGAERFAATVPYFYRLHDLEHLAGLLDVAAADADAKVGRALYEHIARNWDTLDRFSRLQVAQIARDRAPALRTKPPRASDQELVDAGDDFWVQRLQKAWFCPTEHGPRPASMVWFPTPEVQRRFGSRTAREHGHYLVPVLTVDDPALTRGKARGFAQIIGLREELTPATFTLNDALVVLNRLGDVYGPELTTNPTLRTELREVIRPAYRDLFELLSNRERPSEGQDLGQPPLADAPLLAYDGTGAHRFMRARDIFYAERRDTRERLHSGEGLWTFVIEAYPGAQAPLTTLFGVRTLEDSLRWIPDPGEYILGHEDLAQFRAGLWELGPYILARIRVDRADDRLVSQDTRRLRRFIDVLEPVTHLSVGCMLDGRALAVTQDQRLAYVASSSDGPAQAIVVWDEHPWPPTEAKAEALASALCEVLGAGYFESFLALIQARSKTARDRLLQRAGAPRDVDEMRVLLQGGTSGDERPARPIEPDLKTAAPAGLREGVASPDLIGSNPDDGSAKLLTPLFAPEDLLVDGSPLHLSGEDVRQGGGSDGRATITQRQGQNRTSGFGGRTDLDALDQLGMSIALAYERSRLRKAGFAAEIFDLAVQAEQPAALVFDVTSPAIIARTRTLARRFDAIMERLQKEAGISVEWPGFDILSLNTLEDGTIDRCIELKSSGVDARTQEMSWNEWKVAAESPVRSRFFLYLVGNLRSDLQGHVPFVRTIQDPFGQLAAEIRTSRKTQRQVQLAVRSFQEAEHLDLTVLRPAPCR